MVAHPYPGENGGINPPKPTSLVIFVQLAVKQLFEVGRDFLWPKPERCPRCGGRIWGHGFVPAYFDGYDQPLWLKRYQCPDCGCVIRMRPRDYFQRFQASIYTIRDCLVLLDPAAPLEGRSLSSPPTPLAERPAETPGPSRGTEPDPGPVGRF